MGYSMIIWEVLSIFGDVQFWVGAALTSTLFLFTIPKRGKKHIAWFVFLVLPAVVMSWMVTGGLKEIFKIPRPCLGLSFCPTTYSFPSGHATVIFAAVTTLSLYYKDKRLAFLLYILSGFVALSRIILGVHRLEDVMIGLLIGIVIGILVQKAYDNYKKDVLELVSEIK